MRVALGTALLVAALAGTAVAEVGNYESSLEEACTVDMPDISECVISSARPNGFRWYRLRRTPEVASLLSSSSSSSSPPLSSSPVSSSLVSSSPVSRTPAPAPSSNGALVAALVALSLAALHLARQPRALDVV